MTHHLVPIEINSPQRSYTIHVGRDIMAEAGTLIAQTAGTKRLVIITDLIVAPLYLQRLEAVLMAAGHTVLPPIILPHGESSKSFDVLQSVLNQLFERGIDRHSMLVALGGGVIGDLTGFIASIALRGIDFIQVPTTLLAQVDSSVGGKTGINSAYGKNTVGTFYQPRLVLADVSTLDSLPQRALLAGYAEIVKYGLIQDAAFFAWCCAHAGKLLMGDHADRATAITKSCTYKAQIVAADERESGLRALLNLGHTFGHALESATGYNDTLLHGEAVAIGTAMAFTLSTALGLCPEADTQAVHAHFNAIDLPVAPPSRAYDIDQLMALMAQDKKAADGKLTLILVRGIGDAFIATNVDPAPVRALWEKYLA